MLLATNSANSYQNCVYRVDKVVLFSPHNTFKASFGHAVCCAQHVSSPFPIRHLHGLCSQEIVVSPRRRQKRTYSHHQFQTKSQVSRSWDVRAFVERTGADTNLSVS